MSVQIATSPVSQDTIASQAGLCRKSFEVCLHEAARVHPRELSMIEDQLSRFSLWTGGIRVFGQSRQSLDHRLREAPQVRDVVLTLLEALVFRLEDCASILQPLRSLQDVVELDPIDHSFLQVIDHISSQISMLHKFSNTIRRASKHSGNIKAATDYVIKSSSGDDLGPFLRSVFLFHMRDSFPQMAENLRERLASTMLLRWKRVLYRRSRYGNGSIQITPIPQQPDTKMPTTKSQILSTGLQGQSRAVNNTGDDEQRSAVPSHTQSATTLAIDSFQKASAPSVVSDSRTVAMPRHGPLRFPPAPTWIVEQKYRQLKAQKQPSSFEPPLSSRAPSSEKSQKSTDPLWKEALLAVGEITCPYCFYTLPAVDITNERKWALHVKNDLDPYVCLFQECESPNELYAHSADWLKHMRGHALRWRCASKAHPEHVSTSRAEYIDHMRTAHNSKLSDNQLRIMADRSGRTIGPLFSCCPLCDSPFDQDGQQLEEHIVGHLRELAIKSLPPYYDEWDGNDGSDDQTSALSVVKTRSTIKKEQAVLMDDAEVIYGNYNIQRDDISNLSTSTDQDSDDSKVQVEPKSPNTSGLGNLTKMSLREIKSLVRQPSLSLVDWRDDVGAAKDLELDGFEDSRLPEHGPADEQQPGDTFSSPSALWLGQASLNKEGGREGDEVPGDNSRSEDHRPMSTSPAPSRTLHGEGGKDSSQPQEGLANGEKHADQMVQISRHTPQQKAEDEIGHDADKIRPVAGISSSPPLRSPLSIPEAQSTIHQPSSLLPEDTQIIAGESLVGGKQSTIHSEVSGSEKTSEDDLNPSIPPRPENGRSHDRSPSFREPIGFKKASKLATQQHQDRQDNIACSSTSFPGDSSPANTDKPIDITSAFQRANADLRYTGMRETTTDTETPNQLKLVSRASISSVEDHKVTGDARQMSDRNIDDNNVARVDQHETSPTTGLFENKVPERRAALQPWTSTQLGARCPTCEDPVWILPGLDCPHCGTYVGGETATEDVNIKTLSKLGSEEASFRSGETEMSTVDHDHDHEISLGIRPERHEKSPSTSPEVGEKIDEQRTPTRDNDSNHQKNQDMWTEITKDLVIREAIEQMGYPYEETETFFYVLKHLTYEDVLELTQISDEIKGTRRQGQQHIPIRDDNGNHQKNEDMWTEITKDLVIREAIEEMGYPYKETESFFYVMEYLTYEDVVELCDVSDGIKDRRRQGDEDVQWRPNTPTIFDKSSMLPSDPSHGGKEPTTDGSLNANDYSGYLAHSDATAPGSSNPLAEREHEDYGSLTEGSAIDLKQPVGKREIIPVPRRSEDLESFEDSDDNEDEDEGFNRIMSEKLRQRRIRRMRFRSSNKRSWDDSGASATDIGLTNNHDNSRNASPGAGSSMGPGPHTASTTAQPSTT